MAVSLRHFESDTETKLQPAAACPFIANVASHPSFHSSPILSSIYVRRRSPPALPCPATEITTTPPPQTPSIATVCTKNPVYFRRRRPPHTSLQYHRRRLPCRRGSDRWDQHCQDPSIIGFGHSMRGRDLPVHTRFVWMYAGPAVLLGNHAGREETVRWFAPRTCPRMPVHPDCLLERAWYVYVFGDKIEGRNMGRAVAWWCAALW